MSQDESKRKLHCNSCAGERWHLLLHQVQKSWQEDDEPGNFYEEICDYMLAECSGCEEVSLHTEWRSSSSSEVILSRWPPKISRKEPRWLFSLLVSENFNNPYKYEFLKEIYIALSNNNLRLAVIGVRALLEQVMIESVGDQKSFKENLNKFMENGYISRVQKDTIVPVLEAGHASMHRGFKAKKAEVEALVDVVENIIESIYINHQKLAKIAIPERGKA